MIIPVLVHKIFTDTRIASDFGHCWDCIVFVTCLLVFMFMNLYETFF